MFIVFRRIDRWLHQHLFKVGWLLTQNYETTTILYYTFFLPGVVLHELIYWLVAGVLNVRAEHAIKWPEKQEVGELKLNFVQLARRTGRLPRAVISAAPLVAGLFIIWFIATNIFDVAAFMQIISSGELTDVAAGFNQLLSTPDFWLWFYIVFTISNTMFPTIPKDLQGWRAIAAALAIAFLILFVLGVGNSIFSAIAVPLTTSLNVLEGTLTLIIGINIVTVLVFGTIESVIERITGRSATFRRGKMVTMTREEAIAARDRERQRQRAAQARRHSQSEEVVIPSVYHLTLPVPGAPGEEPLLRTQPTLLDIDDETEEQGGNRLSSGEPTKSESRIGTATISRESEQGPRFVPSRSLPPMSNDEDDDHEEEENQQSSAMTINSPARQTSPFTRTPSISASPAASQEDDNSDDDIDDDIDEEDIDEVEDSEAEETTDDEENSESDSEEETKEENADVPLSPFQQRLQALSNPPSTTSSFARPASSAAGIRPFSASATDDDDDVSLDSDDDDELVYEDVDDEYDDYEDVDDEPF